MICSIIGNGKSRENLIDFEKLANIGPIYGCNALYRDLPLNAWKYITKLCAVDPDMRNEITNSNFPLNKFIYADSDSQQEPAGLYPGHTGLRPRNNAGMFAMQCAINAGAEKLLLFGFDFLAVEHEIALSNIYEGSSCYGPETRTNIADSRRRMGYLTWLIEKNPEIKFTFVFPKNLKVYLPTQKNVSINTGIDLDYEKMN